MQLESEKKPRVVADEAEVDYRTRTDSLLRVASQVYFFAIDSCTTSYISCVFFVVWRV